MIKTSDIKAAIITRLKAKYSSIPIVAMQVSGQFVTPCFGIHFVNSQNSPDGFAWQKRTKRIDVMYYPKREVETTQTELYDVADVLENEVFHNGIAVKDRFFTFLNTEIEVVDFVLHFSFQIEYFNIFDDAGTGAGYNTEMMENLDMKLTVETKEGEGEVDIVEITS